MTSRTKAKSSGASEPETAADSAEAKEPALCGALHALPLLSHVTCQRPAGHTDDQPEGPDQGKHRARVAGVAYIW